MTSPITGVWELVSDNEKGIRIFTETHNGSVLERQNNRRGFVSVYTVEGNHVQASILVDTATNAMPTGEFEFQFDEGTLTIQGLTPGALVPEGHVDVWHKVSDVTMTSPFAGVWELISETDKGLNVRTDTHWATVVERESIRRGLAGTYTVDGNRASHANLFDTATNAPPQIDIEFQHEGETLIAKRLSGTTAVPDGYIDRWRKIG